VHFKFHENTVKTSTALRDAANLPEAERALRLAIQREPRNGAALCGLGAMLARQKRYADAIPWLEQAIARLPSNPQAHADLAESLRGVDRNAEAATHFDRAAALRPDDRQLQLLSRLQRAILFDEQGNNDRALAGFEDAVQHHPDSADAWAGLGMVQMNVVSAAAAEESFRRALQIDPERQLVNERFGQVLQDQRLYEDAAIVFERVLNRWPRLSFIPGRLMHCKMLMADWMAYAQLQRGIEAGLAAGRLTSEPFGLQGYCADPELLQRCATAAAAAGYPDRSAELSPAAIGRGTKIRVGYVSGEFRNQATSVLLTEVLEQHDRARFEVFAFDNGWDDSSPLRRRIEAAVKVVPIRKLDDLEAAQAIRDLEVDILVNLNGYFGRTRTALFSLRPTPIQVNYLGFPGTVGAPYIDYIVADRTVIPAEHERFYAEKVVTLPDCYQPNDSQRKIAEGVTRADASLPDNAFVFCCLNNVYKVTPAIFDIWMRLLLKVPDSVLLLYSDIQVAHVNLHHEAGARGVDPARILFAQPWANEKHLARLQLCDLFLDTLPYNAHTTGSDALWAGLPVLTCTGTSFPGRVGTSLLQALGLPELVTDSLVQYETMALRLATESSLLASLRQRLAVNRHTAPLYDTPTYTRHLESAYALMVERARANLPPAPLGVARQTG